MSIRNSSKKFGGPCFKYSSSETHRDRDSQRVSIKCLKSDCLSELEYSEGGQSKEARVTAGPGGPGNPGDPGGPGSPSWPWNQAG